MKKALLLLLLCATSISAFATAYFTAPGGTANYSVVANWWTTAAGTGSHPAVFTTVGDTWTFQGTCSSTSATFTLAGTVTINAGAVVNAPATTFTIGGGAAGSTAWTNNGTFNAGSGTVVFSCPTGAHAATGNMTGASKFNNLTYTGTVAASALTFSSAVAVGGNYSQTLGVVTTPTSTLTVTGNFALSATTLTAGAAGTINIGGSYTQSGGTFTAGTSTVNITGNFNKTAGTFAAGSSTLKVGNNWQNAGVFNSGTGAVFFTATSSGHSLNGTLSGTSKFNSITFSGVGGDWTNNSTLAVSGNLTIASGAKFIANAQINMNGANWTNNGSFDANFNTVNFNGAGASALSGSMTGANQFYYITFNGTGTSTFNNAATVASDFVINDGTVVAPSSTLTVGGQWQNGASFVHNNGTVIMNGTFGYYYMDYNMNAPNSFYNLTFDGIGSDWDFDYNYVDVDNDFTINNGEVIASPGYDLRIGGNWTNNGSFIHNDANVVMTATSTGKTLTGSMTGSNTFGYLTFDGVGGSWTFNNDADIAYDFYINNGTLNGAPGTLSLAANWNNNAVFNHNNGNVTFNGFSAQTINGSTTFNGLTISNGSGVVAGSNVGIDGTLTLNSGLLDAGTSNITFGLLATSAAGSPSASSMLVSTGGGRIKKLFAANGSFQFPIGETVTNTYSPITLAFTAGTYAPGANAAVYVGGTKHPSNANVSNYLARYWQVALTGITSPVYNVSAIYRAADVAGTEASISAGKYTGILPWVRYSAVNAATHTLSATGVTSPVADFTGISTAAPTLTSPGTQNLCKGDTVVIAPAASGDPALTFTWSPASGLNSTFGYAVLASPTVTTTYTVIATDGNGFVTAPVFITVTVNPKPAAITGTTVICTGRTSALTTLSGGGAWTSSNNFLASVGTTGIVTGQSAGNATISYTLPTGCYSYVATTINPSPAGITGVASVCIGSATSLADPSFGGVWSSSSSALATVTATGIVTPVNPGTPNISYTYPATGCYALAQVTVNALPFANNITVTGLSSYCTGSAGVQLGLDGSTIGVTYKLYNGPGYVGAQPGTGSTLNFGYHALPGTYTVVGTNDATGCTRNMGGSIVVTESPLPLTFAASGDAGYCTGDAGADITLLGSQTGVLYRLYSGVTALSTVLGSGASIDFGLFGAGGYTIVATDASSGCETTMPGVVTISENPLPSVKNLIGGGNYCSGGAGVHIGLDYSDAGINYVLSDAAGVPAATAVSGAGSALDFGTLFPAGTYTVVATNAVTGCVADMAGSATITVDPLPTVYGFTASSGGGYCLGGAGAHIALASSDFGINYSLYNGATPIGSPSSGIADTLEFGLQALPGSYTVTAVDAATGCTTNMAGTVSVTAVALPVAFPLTGGGNYCSGGAGSLIGVSNSEIGVDYQLAIGGVPVGTLTHGIGASFDFGRQTGIGNYTVSATSSITGCTNSMAGSADVNTNALPNIDTLTGGGTYCSGDGGVHVGLSYSDIGISYQLFNTGIATGSPVSGAGSGLDFGLQPAIGTYSVVATNSSTGCTSTMYGTTTVTVNPRPTVYMVASSASSYCAGGAGVDLLLSNSDAGINYQLLNAGVPAGSVVAGTGATLHFGYQTTPGIYTVAATDAVNGCASNMSLSATVAVNPLPTMYTMTGGGDFCTGSTGVLVGLTGSAAGIDYQLLNAGMPVGSPVHGGAGLVSFGLQTTGGTYTVVAANTATSCTSNMNGTALVSPHTPPVAYTVTGSGAYCTGGSGLHVSLTGSQLGATYQLYRGGVPATPALSGTGTSLDFGLQSLPGAYTIVATDMATTCANNMAATATITVNAAPADFTAYGGGTICTGDAGLHIRLSGSQPGVNYGLYNGGLPVGGSFTGTGTMIDFGAHSLAGRYTIMAADAATTCSSTMPGSPAITVNPAPDTHSITGGGAYCAGSGGVHIGLALGDHGVSYELFNGAVSAGTAAGAGMAVDFGLQTGSGTYRVVATNTATGCTGDMTGFVPVTVSPVVVPSVSVISGAGDTSCAGASVTYTAVPVNGGTAPGYSWKVNGTLVAGAGDTYSYVPAHGDLITATLTSAASCATPLMATGAASAVVMPGETPTAVATSDRGDKVCPGTPVTFTATSSFGGGHPVFSWIRNSVVVGSGDSYTIIPADKDVIRVLMSSDFRCRTTDRAFSNDIVMAVKEMNPPSLALAISPGTTIAPGVTVTITAKLTNAGTGAAYRWYLNGALVRGLTTSVFSSDQLSDGDSVTCAVTTTSNCGEAETFNSVIIGVHNLGVRPVGDINNMVVVPNPNKGTFTIKGSATTPGAEMNIQITDMLGQVVYSGQVLADNGSISKQISLSSSLANGMYLLNLRSAGGNQVFHIVVER